MPTTCHSTEYMCIFVPIFFSWAMCRIPQKLRTKKTSPVYHTSMCRCPRHNPSNHPCILEGAHNAHWLIKLWNIHMFLYGAVAGFEPTYGHLITPWHAFEHAFIASFGNYVITAAVTLHPHPYPRGHCNVMSIGCEYEYENGSVIWMRVVHTHTLWENKDTEFHTNRLWMWIGFVLMYHQMLWDICDITNISQCICVHGWGSRDV